MAVNKLKDFHKGRATTFVNQSQENVVQTKLIVLSTVVIGMLFGCVLGFIFASKTSNSITQVASHLSENASHVATASTQIASASSELSQSTSEQASSLEQTAASLEQITAMISKASENSEETYKNSEQSQKKAEEGRDAVNQMTSSMEQINQSNNAILQQIEQSNIQMTEIVSVIQDIGNKTKVINEIVFQTKLLSFNASVEAARAGEHGKGFAVVAEEIGNLAQMSGNAANEITSMLQESISKVEKIVEETQNKVNFLIQDGKEKVDNGMIVAKKCSNLLNEIVQNVSHVSYLSREISQASKEQALGVTEINKAVTELDSVTHQNRSTSEKASMAASDLAQQSELLNSIIKELTLLVSGKMDGKVI